MTPSLLLVYLFGILNAQGYKRLSETRLEGTQTVHDGIDSSIMCCALCEVKDTCIAVNHNKDLGVCEVIQRTGVKPHPTTDSLWTAYFMNISDIDYKHGATASQSSTSESHVASFAIDGLGLEELSFSSTLQSTTNWLLIDFNRNYPIKEFVIWQPLILPFHAVVTVSTTLAVIDDEDSLCTTYEGPIGYPALVSCNKTIEGRFFKYLMETAEPNNLFVAEVNLL